jgi:hypothetical protein
MSTVVLRHGPAGLRHPEHGQIPAGANTGVRPRPSSSTLTGLDFSTAADARSKGPTYPRATGTRRNAAAGGAEGNFIIGPTHEPFETVAKDGVPRGFDRVLSHVVEGQRDLQPRLIRDDPAGCSNGRSCRRRRRPATGRYGRHHQPPGDLDSHHHRLPARELCAGREPFTCWATAARPPTRTSQPSLTA